jgi:xylulokinase
MRSTPSCQAAARSAGFARLVRAPDVAALVAEVESAQLLPDDTPVFTPYLAGERTPHDDPGLMASLSGMTHRCGPLHLVQAVMEGVAMALADGQDVLLGSGARIEHVALTGGGAAAGCGLTGRCPGWAAAPAAQHTDLRPAACLAR